jgi:phage head maturation protease
MARSTITFTAAVFAVDQAKRTLSGMLLPFGEVSRPALDEATGKPARFTFADASKVTLPADPADVVLNIAHDRKSLDSQVGVGTKLTPTAEGVLAEFRIARTPEGDRVLALAEDRILKAFSAEVDGEFTPDQDGVQHAQATTLTGAAVVRVPAFTGAHITSVAASAAPHQEETNVTDTKVGADVTVAFAKADGDQLMAEVQALTEKIAELEKVKLPVGPGTAQFQVVEEPIYRFAGVEAAPSGFDFATDLLAAGKDGDGAALARLQAFTTERLSPQFADQPTTTADTAAVNPSTYRPDMFLGQAPVPASPLYDFFHKGGLSNVTPFFWSKLDRVNTDVGVADHVEDANPESRDLVTAAGATVTPVPVSGRVHITREVADQGGNPVVSGLAWSEFERSFKIALETKTAAIVAAGMAGITALATVPTGTAGPAAGLLVEGGLVDLQFIPDGYRFARSFGHVDLYKALALAANANGEKIYPILTPTNRSGTTADKYAYLTIAGYGMYPAASLGVTGVGANNSLVADPAAIHVWNSGLTRLDKLNETVAGWDMATFAYFAGVLYDVTGLRKITYTK